MNSNMHRIFVGALLLLALSVVAYEQDASANAFFIQEVSASGVGQGAAVVAGGSSPSSMYQNAANISFLDGLQLELTGTAYFPHGRFTNPQGESTSVQENPIAVPHFFASYKINDWLAVGFGEFVDFGLAIDWPKDWEGSHILYHSSLTSFTFNPTISFGPFYGFAIAVGFDAKWGSVVIKRSLTLGMLPAGSATDNTLTLGGETWGFGGNIGMMYQPADWVRMGLAYRSGINMKVDDGKADFDVSDAFAPRFPDQKFSTSLKLPHLISMGVRFWPMENLAIELDGWATLWSSFDKLKFEFDEGLGLGPDKRLFVQEEIKDFEDFLQIRLGAEWWFHEHFVGRLGIMLDGSVVPDKSLDPMLPDGHRINSCIGFGTEWSGFFADIAYMFVYVIPRDVGDVEGNPLPGKYDELWTNVLSVTVGYRYDFLAKDKIDTPEPEKIPDEIEEPEPEQTKILMQDIETQTDKAQQAPETTPAQETE